MRILIATWHRNLVGGTEKYLQALLPGLLQRGHEVSLCYEQPCDETQETIDAPDMRLHTWSLAGQDVQTILDSLSRWTPDIVYLHGLESAELEGALIAKYATALFAHNYYGTCGTGTKCHAFPRVQPCARRLGPMCLVLHYPRRCGGLNPWETWRLYRRQTQRHSLLSRVDALLVASTHMQREFLNHGVNSAKLHVVPHPTTDADPMPRLPKALDGRLLLIGRLTELKGGHYLVQAIPKAAARLGRPLKLTIAGDGPSRVKLEHLAQQYGVDVEFTGWVSTGRKLDLMRRSDLLVVPSLWPEPFGLVGVEAGSLGLPAVAYDAGGIRDWLVPGESGELAPGDPPTPDGLADAIVRALRTGEHYASLANGARKIAGQFTLERHLNLLEPILEQASSKQPQMVR